MSHTQQKKNTQKFHPFIIQNVVCPLFYANRMNYEQFIRINDVSVMLDTMLDDAYMSEVFDDESYFSAMSHMMIIAYKSLSLENLEDNVVS